MIRDIRVHYCYRNSQIFISGWLLCFCWLDHDEIQLENCFYLIHQLSTNKWRVRRILEAIYIQNTYGYIQHFILYSAIFIWLRNGVFWDRKWKSTIISCESLVCFVPTEWKWCYHNISLHCREKTIQTGDKNVLFSRKRGKPTFF